LRHALQLAKSLRVQTLHEVGKAGHVHLQFVVSTKFFRDSGLLVRQVAQQLEIALKTSDPSRPCSFHDQLAPFNSTRARSRSRLPAKRTDNPRSSRSAISSAPMEGRRPVIGKGAVN